MKKLLIIFTALLLLVAYLTKPDYKTCVIQTVSGVWGDYTPDPNKFPQYFEQFMDLNSKDVQIDDWIFVKRIRYRYQKEYKTVAIGAFRRVFFI